MIYSVLVTVFRSHTDLVSRARFVVGSRDDAEVIEHMCSVDRLHRIAGDLHVRKQMQVRVNRTWIDADEYSLGKMLRDIQRALNDVPKEHPSLVAKVTDDGC